MGNKFKHKKINIPKIKPLIPIGHFTTRDQKANYIKYQSDKKFKKFQKYILWPKTRL
jgi:hypothetical protein